jgi:YVTN family beta-propeller protein
LNQKWNTLFREPLSSFSKEIAMRNLNCILACLVLAVAAASASGDGEAKAPALSVIKTIPTGSTGKWDYLCVDAEARRLYIPRSTHVQVLDLEKDKVVGDIPETRGVHGVAVATEQGLGFATDGRDNTVTVFDLKTLKVKQTIKTGTGPDAIVFDPASKHILAMNHKSGDITVIDPAALDKEPATIAVGGTLEFAVADGDGHVFVNVEDKSEVVEIDSKANHVLAHWPLSQGKSPTGLAIDTEKHRLYSGCGNAKMVVLDAGTGKELGVVAIGKGVDGVAWDPTLKAAISANGKDGTLSVVQETSPGKFEVTQTVKTLTGARTIAYDPKTGHLLLPCTEAGEKGQQPFVIAVVGAAEASH